MKLIKVNWYGFVHEKISKRYGKMEFVNSFCVYGEDQPVAVYRCLEPDRSKGHKDYFLIQILYEPASTEPSPGLIRGMDEKDFALYRFQEALHCFQCDQVVFSVMHHDQRHCKCGAVFVDGGKDYLRVGGLGYPDQCGFVTVDLLYDCVIPEPEHPITQ